MKIAQLVLRGLPGMGGIEKYAQELGSRMVAKGHNVTSYVFAGEDCPKNNYDGMVIKSVPKIPIKGFDKITGAMISAFMASRRKDIDLIHLHAFGPGAASIFPRIFNTPCLVQGHGIEWRRSRWGFLGRTALKLLEVPSVKLPNSVSVVSKVQRDYLLQKYGVMSKYIPTGVNPAKPSPAKIIKEKWGLIEGKYILFAARLVREKGVHRLIEAYNRLQTDQKLVIAGDAENEAAYIKEIKKLSHGNPKIVFTGYVRGETLNELFSNACLFIQPSELEGLPIGLLEAMSYGVPCLVSDIPENLEAIQSFGTVFHVNSCSHLAIKLEHCLNNLGALKINALNGQEHVLKNHLWEDIASEFEALYATILNK